MIRSLIVTATLLLCSFASAQDTFQDVSTPSVRQLLSAGLSLPMGAFGDKTGTDAGAAKTGWTVNYTGVYALPNDFAAVASVHFAMNGFDTEGTGITEAGSYSSFAFIIGAGPDIKAGAASVIVTPFVGLFSGSTPELKSPLLTVTSAGARSITYGGAITVLQAPFGLSMEYLIAKPEYTFELTGFGSSKVKQPSNQFLLTVGYSW